MKSSAFLTAFSYLSTSVHISFFVKFCRQCFQPISESSFDLCIVGEISASQTFLMGPNKGKSNVAKSGEYVGCAIVQPKGLTTFWDLRLV